VTWFNNITASTGYKRAESPAQGAKGPSHNFFILITRRSVT